MSRGVIYIASGDKYIEEALRSVKSLNENNPDLETTLFTDEDLELEEFDNIEVIDGSIDSMVDSIVKPHMMPYEKNLFLDTDTYITGDISELFEGLEKFDMLFCQAPGRSKIIGAPDCVREFNTGVIGYQKNKKTKNFFREWLEEQKRIEREDPDVGRSGGNQHAFAKTVYDSDLDFLTLPPEYNTRIPRCGYLNGEVKIIHGRPRTSMEKVEKKLNESQDSRVHYATQSLLGSGRAVKTFSTSYAIQKGLKVLLTQGPRTLIKKIQQHIRKR